MEKNNFEDVQDSREGIYPYQIIEFIVRGPKSANGRQSDLIPSSWVSFNKQKGKLEAQFLPPPYDEERCNILHYLVENKLPPMTNWPFYTIKLIGQANSYDEGTKKLLTIKNDDSYIYTADSDLEPSEKAALLTAKFKESQKQSNLRDLPYVPEIDLTSSDTDTSLESREGRNIKALIKNKKIRTKNTKKVTKRKTKVNSSAVSKTLPTKKGTKKKQIPDVVKNAENETNKNLAPNFNPLKENLRSTKETLQHNNKSKLDTLSYAKSNVFTNNDLTTDSNNFKEALISTNKTRENNALDYDSLEETYNDKSTKSPVSTRKTIQCDKPSLDYNPLEGTSADTNESSTIRHDGQEMNETQSSNVAKKGKKLKNFEKESSLDGVAKDINFILMSLKGLSVQWNEIKNELNCHRDVLESIATKVGVSSSKGFISANKLNLPFKTIDEFLNFNEKLENDSFRTDFTCSLHFLFDKDLIIAKSILNIFKKYFSREVAMQFTNIKKKENKLLLKDYKIHFCICETVTVSHSTEKVSKATTEKCVIEAIGNTILGARDWEGGRKERQKKNE